LPQKCRFLSRPDRRTVRIQDQHVSQDHRVDRQSRHSRASIELQYSASPAYSMTRTLHIGYLSGHRSQRGMMSLSVFETPRRWRMPFDTDGGCIQTPVSLQDRGQVLIFLQINVSTVRGTSHPHTPGHGGSAALTFDSLAGGHRQTQS
jgi:hypothetical protein